MVTCRVAMWLVATMLAACASTPPPPPSEPREPPPTKGFSLSLLLGIHDSVYAVVDRGTTAPAGYGLYTFALTRAANRNSVRVVSELFTTLTGARDAAIARENLNLVMIPVSDAALARRMLDSARESPEATAATLMQRHYDFGQAALLIASVCRPENGPAVMRACGSRAPDGPLLVTVQQRPVDATIALGQRMLVVNLTRTSPAAIGEVVAAYREQVLRRDFADRAEVDSWRLTLLNRTLDAARLLPEISKAYAAGR